MTPDQAKGLRDILCARVREMDPDQKAALALSGGVDSTTILFAMLATGRRPRCYTFYCQDTISSDLLASRNLTKHFGLELVEVEIPWDMKRLVADLRKIIPHCEVMKKTIVQCMHPWLYIYPAMVERGDALMLNGLGGDDHYCMQRKVSVLLNTEGEQAVLDKGWRHCFGDDLKFSPANIERFGRTYGITNKCVYFDQKVEDWFCRFPIRDLHRGPDGRGLEKAASLYAFADYYSQGSFRRLHHSYQKNSRLQEMHEALTGTDYNTRGARDVIAIYRDIASGIV